MSYEDIEEFARLATDNSLIRLIGTLCSTFRSSTIPLSILHDVFGSKQNVDLAVNMLVEVSLAFKKPNDLIEISEYVMDNLRDRLVFHHEQIEVLVMFLEKLDVIKRKARYGKNYNETRYCMYKFCRLVSKTSLDNYLKPKNFETLIDNL